jgi:hypothetical protein
MATRKAAAKTSRIRSQKSREQMQDSPWRIQFNNATAQLTSLVLASTSELRLERYEGLLHALSRVWNNASERLPSKHTDWPQELRKFADARRSDPLLMYLAEARNALQHPGTAVATSLPRWEFEPRDPTLPLDLEVFNIEGGPTGFGGKNVKVVEHKPSLKLLPVITRHNKHLAVPESHLGNSIHGVDEVKMVQLALAWHVSFLKEFEAWLAVQGA